MRFNEFRLAFQFLIFACILPFALIAENPKNERNYRKARPSFVVILADNFRYDPVDINSEEKSQLPEIGKLAEEGVYFQNAFTSSPFFESSQASFLSGIQERTHRYTRYANSIPDEYIAKSYPKILRDAGYSTGFVGNLGVMSDQTDQLFSKVDTFGFNPNNTGRSFKKNVGDSIDFFRIIGDRAIGFIENSNEDVPFCLTINFHSGYTPVTKNLPDSVNYSFGWTNRFDHELGRIRKALKENDLEDNTVVILMCNSGSFADERERVGKSLLYDFSIRIPLIISDPRIAKHRDIDALVLNLDVAPTIMELAGVEQPESWHGKSLCPILYRKREYNPHDTVLIEQLCEFSGFPASEGVRTAEWKYFRNLKDKTIEELYHVLLDPDEQKNLSADPDFQDELVKLRTSCDALIRKYVDHSSTPAGLSVEYIREPRFVAVQDSLPEYSWIVPEKGISQNAFQILVASSKERINNNIADVWDSGRRLTHHSTNIRHEGKSLQPNSVYFWKVRIWDQENRLSEYSSPQEFRTGTFSETVSTGNAFQIEYIQPILIEKTDHHSYFVDFGKDAFGTLQLDYDARRADTLIIRLGEKLKGKSIDRSPGGTIRYAETKLIVQEGKKTYTLKLSPDKRNTLPDKAVLLPDSFGVVMPFRYCEIENFRSRLSEKSIRQKAFFSYFDEGESYFECSDSILNQVWDLCKYSIKATTFAGLYVDGDRERIPYEADAYINQLSHYGADREYAIGKQTIEWFMKKPTWPTEWLLHTAMMVYQDYLYTGDTELIQNYFPLLKKKTLMDLRRDDGLISTVTAKIDAKFMQDIGFTNTNQQLRDIVDWPDGKLASVGQNIKTSGERDGYDMVAVNTVVNCFFYHNMQIMAELAGLLGEYADQAEFQLIAAQVKKSINEKLFDTKTGIYIDGEGSSHSALHANMMPLAFGLVPEKNLKTVVDFVKSRGMACSVYGAQYLLEGLYEAGEDQYALDLMRATHDRSWWNMIRVGSTITMEAWDMKYKPNSDWNHAWGAAPGNIIPRYLWGIKPVSPAFELIEIKPQMADLANCSIAVPTLKGQIKGNYNRVNANFKVYELVLPANTGGNFSVLDSDVRRITINGKYVNPVFRSVRLEPGVNRIEVSLGRD